MQQRTSKGRLRAVSSLIITILLVLLVGAIGLLLMLQTFTGGGHPAYSTQAKANMKQVVNAVESCATANLDGSIDGSRSPGKAKGTNCADASVLRKHERGLQQIGGDGDRYFVDGIAAVPGQVAIHPIGTQGYVVTARVQRDDDLVSYTEEHLQDGTVRKTCAPKEEELCASGRW